MVDWNWQGNLEQRWNDTYRGKLEQWWTDTDRGSWSNDGLILKE
jgi:hypothetical protein